MFGLSRRKQTGTEDCTETGGKKAAAEYPVQNLLQPAKMQSKVFSGIEITLVHFEAARKRIGSPHPPTLRMPLHNNSLKL